jgi:hypothetical protein
MLLTRSRLLLPARRVMPEGTSYSFRPEGRPATAATASSGRSHCLLCRHADWIELVHAVGRANPPQPIAPEYDLPSTHARGAMDPAEPGVCPGFPVRAPSLHRCLSTFTHPRACFDRVRPCRQRRAIPLQAAVDQRRSTSRRYSTDESVVRIAVSGSPHPILPWAYFPFEV